MSPVFKAALWMAGWLTATLAMTVAGREVGRDVPIFVLIFPLVGFFMLRSAVRSNQREIKAFVRGTPIVARVVYPGPDTSTKMNGRHPHMIRWSFDVQGKTYEGSISHMERARIDPLVAGEHVIVLHDPQSPATSTVYVA